MMLWIPDLIFSINGAPPTLTEKQQLAGSGTKPKCKCISSVPHAYSHEMWRESTPERDTDAFASVQGY